MRVFILLALPVAALAAGQVLVGAPSQVNELSDKDNEIVDFAFSQLAGSAGLAGGADCGKKKIRVDNFTKQVVAGILYKFDLVLYQECDKEEKSCKMVVFDQPWTSTREVQWDKVVCGNVSK